MAHLWTRELRQILGTVRAPASHPKENAAPGQVRCGGKIMEDRTSWQSLELLPCSENRSMRPRATSLDPPSGSGRAVFGGSCLVLRGIAKDSRISWDGFEPMSWQQLPGSGTSHVEPIWGGRSERSEQERSSRRSRSEQEKHRRTFEVWQCVACSVDSTTLLCSLFRSHVPSKVPVDLQDLGCDVSMKSSYTDTSLTPGCGPTWKELRRDCWLKSS